MNLTIFEIKKGSIFIHITSGFCKVALELNEISKIIYFQTHSELPRWSAYKKCLDFTLKNTDDKKANARDAVRHHEILMKCRFFDSYLQFDEYQKEKHSKVASWTDGDINLIREAAEQYFHSLHDQKRKGQESDFICNFEDKDLELGGRSTSTLAFVRIHAEDFVSKYYIKYVFDSFIQDPFLFFF